MKKDIHPEYKKCVVRCACGETFETGSTLETMNVDICSKCHPFYTGRQKLVDTGGRVDKFRRRQELFAAKSEAQNSGTPEKAADAED